MLACVPCCRRAQRTPVEGEYPDDRLRPAIAVANGESMCSDHLGAHLAMERRLGTPPNPGRKTT